MGRGNLKGHRKPASTWSSQPGMANPRLECTLASLKKHLAYFMFFFPPKPGIIVHIAMAGLPLVLSRKFPY